MDQYPEGMTYLFQDRDLPGNVHRLLFSLFCTQVNFTGILNVRVQAQPPPTSGGATGIMSGGALLFISGTRVDLAGSGNGAFHVAQPGRGHDLARELRLIPVPRSFSPAQVPWIQGSALSLSSTLPSLPVRLLPFRAPGAVASDCDARVLQGRHLGRVCPPHRLLHRPRACADDHIDRADRSRSL